MTTILKRWTKQTPDRQDFDVDFSDYMTGHTDTPASYTVSSDSGLTLTHEQSGSVVKLWADQWHRHSQVSLVSKGAMLLAQRVTHIGRHPIPTGIKHVIKRERKCVICRLIKIDLGFVMARTCRHRQELMVRDIGHMFEEDPRWHVLFRGRWRTTVVAGLGCSQCMYFLY
jgi:hypothetical protein